MVSAQARREQVGFALKRGLSCRRACALLRVARSALSYRRRRPDRDAAVIAAMRDVAEKHTRYGYRMVRETLRRQGMMINPKRAYRLWKQNGLCLPRRRPRKRVRRGERPLPAATGPNTVWAYDFVFDTCANGQKLKCLTVVDEWTREALAIEVDGRIGSRRVIETLARLFSLHGAPRFLRSDNGPEFIATAVQRWLREQEVETAYIEPGKPWQNSLDESFNNTFRNNCLNLEWYRDRREARILIESWRLEYNTVRPHSSLGYQTPAEIGASRAHADSAGHHVAHGTMIPLALSH